MSSNNASRITFQPVLDEEDVARTIYSPSFFEEDRLAPSAFELKELKNGPESYVSVTRLSMCEATKENLYHKPREEGDECVGFAQLNVRQIRGISIPGNSISIDVLPKPNPNNPAHAGIVISLENKRVKAGFINPMIMFVQGQLADISVIKLF